MKNIALYIGFFLLWSPQMALAQAISCSSQGYTIVYVNGVFDTEIKAKADKNQLQLAFDKGNNSKINGESITVQLGYNPTHVAGLGDSLQSVFQQFNSSLSDFDLDTILMQIHPEVSTRKLLIVGHSQGADYANEMYDYLLAHGEPKEAVGVYAVGTPASFVAGGGKYITSTNDKVINWVAIGAAAARAQLPLPGNVTLPLSASDRSSITGGHSFADDYLANASTKITGDIREELAGLVPADATQSGDCFTPPDADAGYKAQQALFAVADPAASVLKAGAVVTLDAGVVALKAASAVAAGAFQFVADAVTLSTAPPSEAQATQKTDSIINKLYGSSLEGLSPEDKKELLGNSQGGAVALAFPKEKPISINGGFVEGTSTGPAETATSSATTTLPMFVPAPSTPTQNGSVTIDVSDSVQETEDPAPPPPDVSEDTPPAPPQPVAPTPPAIAINEIQWAGDAVNPEREWIELKNLSGEDVDLSGLVIVALDGGSQYIPLSGTLTANSFFIIQRDPTAPLNPAANINYDFSRHLLLSPFEQLADSGEQLALVQVGDWGTTTIDKTPPISACAGWCAGKTTVTSGVGTTLSMERIDSSAPADSASNWADNDTYSNSANMPGGNGQPLYATPLRENSAHIAQDSGWFCSPDGVPITPGQNYTVEPGSICTYLSRFVPYQTTVMGGLFKGTVGSSTQAGEFHGWIGTSAQFTEGIDPSEAQPGDDYFVAIWAVRNVPNTLDSYAFPYFFETGELWARDGWGGPLVDTGETTPPTDNYRVIPFVYQP